MESIPWTLGLVFTFELGSASSLENNVQNGGLKKYRPETDNLVMRRGPSQPLKNRYLGWKSPDGFHKTQTDFDLCYKSKSHKSNAVWQSRGDQRPHQCPGSQKNANAFLILCCEHSVVIFFLLNLPFLSEVGLCCTENSLREVVFFVGFAVN